jgi:hypothetical protein
MRASPGAFVVRIAQFCRRAVGIAGEGGGQVSRRWRVGARPSLFADASRAAIDRLFAAALVVLPKVARWRKAVPLICSRDQPSTDSVQLDVRARIVRSGPWRRVLPGLPAHYVVRLGTGGWGEGWGWTVDAALGDLATRYWRPGSPHCQLMATWSVGCASGRIRRSSTTDGFAAPSAVLVGMRSACLSDARAGVVGKHAAARRS